VDTYEPEGPFGAKEAGEGLTNPTAAQSLTLYATQSVLTSPACLLLLKDFQGNAREERKGKER